MWEKQVLNGQGKTRTWLESRSEKDEGLNRSFGVDRKKTGFRNAI